MVKLLVNRLGSVILGSFFWQGVSYLNFTNEILMTKLCILCFFQV